MNVVDLFSGPGGWDTGARELGIRPVGVEWDDSAVVTARAAGHRVVQADVGALDPMAVVRALAAQETVDKYELALSDLISTDEGRALAARIYAEKGEPGLWGLIASPPCQAFSMAGKGEGRRAIDHYRGAITQMTHGEPVDWESIGEACGDERAHLVVEPLRWALALHPSWCAFEQVEPVLPLWEAMAEALRAHGYFTWTGVLSAERFGVAQTRRRAILIASLDSAVSEPVATHRRYVAPRNKPRQEGSLFDAPEPERIVLRGEEHLLPWVSMAQALGWEEGTAAYKVVRGSGSTERHGERRKFPDSDPAPTITSKARSADWHYRNGNQANSAIRPAGDPAPTVHFGNNLNEVTWVVDRPATTVTGDPRMAEAGHHDRQMNNAVRVTIQEAAVLQSFPADYPFAGSKSKQFQQVGNAIPPLLARAVVAEATGVACAEPLREAA